MNTPPHWTTSAFGDSAETRPDELEALRQHFAECSARDARIVALHCGWLRLQALVGSHLVTTLALAVAVVGIGFVLL
ncbi:hypothetical protein CKO44_15230 [Rubrivivax gelatinosus]|uniref:DUF3040 domain-containing protein n=1 Tax=Rubrivivax gelatinosus TaxID=28068 RepID=A0ABS1DXU8_RUBGE|nr:hypothetical protein [Rubrivivax gelatinosus]MBK1614821.1 hypothetical protein [Rubrivivax gelatinosus]MBK1713612.1 hypothetical protein [Rubrivivax gelatinosus]